MEAAETTEPITTREKKEEQDMEETETKKNNRKNTKKQKHQHPNDQTTKSASDFSFKPSSHVKGLRFGGQFIVKSFTIRRARPLEFLQLLSFPATTRNSGHKPPFPSATTFIPTNFTILAHHAWHTLTLGLGTKKSKVLLFVFENEAMKAAIDRVWAAEIPLGEVNKKMIRGLSGCEMARFKFRKGCITFYVYAVRREGCFGFACADDLRTILESVVALKDFLDHTAMLAMPNQKTISFAAPPVAMAY
ncbi:uncharacterized protein LOC111808119 [Cucurbita pepo subsp. pepo]|uniref:uncharacterized protein LOC111808119 n=1 Tax=Cucurbita pepo subsp. pepo TaxID=3664 RepID=UPI000C9D3138|nr:uncharacterized protein LOC111808119 [Cucurbita pepo subsp. pepo]